MASKTTIQLKRRFVEDVANKYRQVDLRAAALVLASAEIDLIRKRTDMGLDRDGKPFRTYNPGYRSWKQRFIKAGWAYRKRQRGGGYRTVKAPVTAFAAEKVAGFMRLTGRLYSAMYVRDVKVTRNAAGTINVEYALDFKTARAKKLANIHNVTGAGKRKVLRKFWGPAKTAKEKAELDKIFKRELRKVKGRR